MSRISATKGAGMFNNCCKGPGTHPYFLRSRYLNFLQVIRRCIKPSILLGMGLSFLFKWWRRFDVNVLRINKFLLEFADWCTSIIYHTSRLIYFSGVRYVILLLGSFRRFKADAARDSIRIEKVPIWSSLFRFWIRNLKCIRCLVNSRCFVVQTICPKIIRILFRIWSYEFAVKPKWNCHFHEYVWRALATTTTRATKTSLAIKMSV